MPAAATTAAVQRRLTDKINRSERLRVQPTDPRRSPADGVHFRKPWHTGRERAEASDHINGRRNRKMHARESTLFDENRDGAHFRGQVRQP